MMDVLAQPTLCCSCSLQSYGTSAARSPVFPMTLLQQMYVYAGGGEAPPEEFQVNKKNKTHPGRGVTDSLQSATSMPVDNN